MADLKFIEALKLLKTLSNDLFTFDAWVPSLKTFIKIKELNTDQQRKLIESAMDSINNKYTFSKIFFDILNENIIDKSNFDKLTIIDKTCIAFYLKSKITENIEISNEDKTLSFKINDILQKYSTYEHPVEETINHIGNESLSIDVVFYIPNIVTDSEFELIINEKLKDNSNFDNVKENISLAFLIEISKHIKEIIFNKYPLEYQSSSVDEKLELINGLPASLTDEIFQKIKNYREKLTEIHTLKSENFSKILEIDDVFFLNT
jgi:hypothetical protein